MKKQNIITRILNNIEDLKKEYNSPENVKLRHDAILEASYQGYYVNRWNGWLY